MKLVNFYNSVYRFYKRVFTKILVDYYLFIIVILIAIHFSPVWNIGLSGVVGLLTFSNTVPGLGHLWFIPTILFCYFLTPIFSEIINELDSKSESLFYFKSIVLIFVFHVVIQKLFGFFNPAWINNYFIGMIYSRIEFRNKKDDSCKLYYYIVECMCLLIIPLQFMIDYWNIFIIPSRYDSAYIYITNYGHVFLGIFIVNILRKGFNSINNSDICNKLFQWSDKYSYDVYLVHLVFIKSPFGFVEYIQNRWVALPLAIIMTIIVSMMLYQASNIIKSISKIIYVRL